MCGFIIRNSINFLAPETKDEVVVAEMDAEYLDYPTTVIQAYGEETVRMCKSGQYAGIWQICQMVHVLQRAIKMHYPDQSPGMERTFCREYRRVYGLDNQLGRRGLAPINVAWTVSRNGGNKFDHFVSVVE